MSSITYTDATCTGCGLDMGRIGVSNHNRLITFICTQCKAAEKKAKKDRALRDAKILVSQSEAPPTRISSFEEMAKKALEEQIERVRIFDQQKLLNIFANFSEKAKWRLGYAVHCSNMSKPDMDNSIFITPEGYQFYFSQISDEYIIFCCNSDLTNIPNNEYGRAILHLIRYALLLHAYGYKNISLYKNLYL